MTHGEHATLEVRMTGAHGRFRNEATRLMTRRLMTQLGEINRRVTDVSSKQKPNLRLKKQRKAWGGWRMCGRAEGAHGSFKNEATRLITAGRSADMSSKQTHSTLGSCRIRHQPRKCSQICPECEAPAKIASANCVAVRSPASRFTYAGRNLWKETKASAGSRTT